MIQCISYKNSNGEIVPLKICQVYPCVFCGDIPEFKCVDEYPYYIAKAIECVKCKIIMEDKKEDNFENLLNIWKANR